MEELTLCRIFMSEVSETLGLLLELDILQYCNASFSDVTSVSLNEYQFGTLSVQILLSFCTLKILSLFCFATEQMKRFYVRNEMERKQTFASNRKQISTADKYERPTLMCSSPVFCDESKLSLFAIC